MFILRSLLYSYALSHSWLGKTGFDFNLSLNYSLRFAPFSFYSTVVNTLSSLSRSLWIPLVFCYLYATFSTHLPLMHIAISFLKNAFGWQKQLCPHEPWRTWVIRSLWLWDVEVRQPRTLVLSWDKLLSTVYTEWDHAWLGFCLKLHCCLTSFQSCFFHPLNSFLDT